MAKMTNKMVEKSFEMGKERFLGKISLQEAVNNLEQIGVNSNSARDYIYLYIHLRNGELFKRRANEFAINYYLENIYKENGIDALKNALVALSKHFEYWESYSGSLVKGGREIYNNYKKIVSIENQM